MFLVIEGSRLDDLEYLARHNIDRNRVSQELTRIFSRMIYITGVCNMALVEEILPHIFFLFFSLAFFHLSN